MKDRLIMFDTVVIIFIIAVIIGVTVLPSGCSSETELVHVNINASGLTNIDNPVLGKEALIELGSGLWYDSVTEIVYWWNGYLHISYTSTTPTPYYAPNGLPYRYNPETNTLEEIER